MAKTENTSNKTKSKNKEENKETPRLKDETRHGVYAIIAFVLALFFTLSAIKKAGIAGSVLYMGMRSLFGFGYFLLPVLCIVLGVSFVRSVRPQVAKMHMYSGVAFLLSSLALMDVSFSNNVGGYIGTIVSWPFVRLFDVYVSVIILVSIILISLFILFDSRPNVSGWIHSLKNLFKKKDALDDFNPDAEPTIVSSMDNTQTGPQPVEEPEEKPTKTKELSEDEIMFPKEKRYVSATYVPPPLSLLERDRGKANVGDIKANANIIKRSLLNFGIEVEMDEITIGPTFTRYALKPAVGVKLSRIVGLQNDLALALAAHPVRIEAPIPGKSLVGIEIPNKTKSTVGLGSLIGDENFQNNSKPLMTVLGRDVAGRPHYMNLAKAPHALIAGTTGSGKSVSIHAIINSLIYRNGPQSLKFIMVDPKRVELTLYNNIPHLLTPVITDAKKAILALKWAAKEMERRYDILQSESVRDIESYHNNIFKKGTSTEKDPMPYIVIIIDELADIMQAYPRELEAAIVRLAQMSRAVGIHLILSTQRPEVNVITGLIKANVPTRIALRVPTGIDSRTILDATGAEKLLGQGDMLFSGGEGQPNRLQSAYIAEDEVKKVVKYLVDSYRDELPDTIELSGNNIGADKSIFESGVDNNDDDEMYEEARRIVIESGKASTSLLQRKLSLGYARAARLMDLLEDRGIIGPGNGAKPREVLERMPERDESGNNIL